MASTKVGMQGHAPAAVIGKAPKKITDLLPKNITEQSKYVKCW